MNQHDRDNLNFILSLDEAGFDEWYATLSDDDVDYALEIIKAGRSEMIVQVAEMQDDVEDCTEAMTVLKEFML